MLVYLVRHGETAYNRDGLGLGRADAALTPFGERQAAALGARLATTGIDRIYSSPLSRCLVTAGHVRNEREIPLHPRDELLELDVGETEGLAFAEMRERYGDFIRAWAGPEGIDAQMPGGESLRELDARLQPFVEHLLGSGDEVVAVISHNFVTRVLLTRLLGLELPMFRSLNVDLASLTSITIRDKRTVIRTLNDCCHLHGLEP